MILTTPAFSAIKKTYPDAELHVLCSKANESVLNNNPFVDEVLIYDKKFFSTLSLAIKLRSKYEIHFDPKDHYSSESSFFALTSNAVKKYGYMKKSSSNFNHPVNQHLKNIHFSTIIKKQLECMGVNINDDLPKPELFPSQESIKYVNDHLKLLGSDFNVINISASKEIKMWPVDNWIELINDDIFKSENLVLSYAPSEKDKASDILSACENLIEFKSRSLEDVFALVKASKAVITIDTALVHIAAAFNKPILTLFGGPDKEYVKWKAISDIEVTIESHGNKVSSIMVNDVINAWKDLLSKIQ